LAELTGRDSKRAWITEHILKYAPEDSACLERAVRAFLELGRLDEAVELITTKQFFVMELAYHTRVLYVRSLLLRGSRLFAEGRFQEAAEDFRRATEYPSNIGASRFHDSSDAQAYYLLGLALEKLGLTEDAFLAWNSAANDIPVRGSEQAFYVGRARERLGRKDSRDAFDLLLPVCEPKDKPQASARYAYLQGLHNLSVGNNESAFAYFKTAREIELSAPTKMHAYLEAICHTRSEGRRMPIPVWWTIEPACVSV
ncbi:MAG: tetratricopeptide repeat protein, partial [Armatimonadota bacterium]|nr:tetratricopeptide repeat protein [Armatimonadota bacterium]